MVELHALFLSSLYFTILEKSLYRKDHTDHRHGYRRDDIETRGWKIVIKRVTPTMMRGGMINFKSSSDGFEAPHPED